jgi:hypothetical protein
MRRLIRILEPMDFGYPVGENEIRPPKKLKRAIPRELVPLYAECDGPDLPDVRNGYFLSSTSHLDLDGRKGERVRVSGRESFAICVFGTDGGGGRFALRLNDGAIDGGAVYYLPSEGAVIRGTWEERGRIQAIPIAGDVMGFLERLADDVEAFARRDEDHKYLDRW